MIAERLLEGRAVARRLNRYLHLRIPTVLAGGETFALDVTLFGPDNLPADEGVSIRFEGCRGLEGLPPSVDLPSGRNGMWTLPGLRAIGPELVLVRGMVGEDEVLSNPAWVFDVPPYRIYWGDLHVHTSFSNCHAWACKSPEFCYEFARDAARLDFAAAADHTRGLAAAADRWPRLQQCARDYEAPGAFAALLAFESSHAQGFGGDNNVYFKGTEGPLFWLERPDMRGHAPKVRLEELWDWLDAAGHEFFSVPHHTGRRGKYRTFSDPTYDPRREPLFEIYSSWGSSEMRHTAFPLSGGNNDDQGYFVDALRHGCRYGVLAASDSHTTMPGGEARSWKKPLGVTPLNGFHHGGLAAVRCAALERSSIWTALRQRQCYGTTFARVPLDFQVGGVPMGSAAPVGRADPLRKRRRMALRFTTTAGGDASVTILRNGQPWRRQVRAWNEPHGAVEELVVEDEEPLAAVAVREARFHPAPFVVYYARLETGDGQTQWTSPVWLDVDG